LGDAEDLIRGKHLLIVPSGALTTLPIVFDREVGRLGAELAPLSEDDRKSLPADVQGGVRVVKPVAGGPAEAAGLLAGDILVAVDRRGFARVPDAIATVQAAGPGHAVLLELVRVGQRLDLTVSLSAVTVKGWKPLFLDSTNAHPDRQTCLRDRDQAPL